MAGSAVYRRDIDQYGTWREHVRSADDAHSRVRELLGADWADAERYALYTLLCFGEYQLRQVYLSLPIEVVRLEVCVLSRRRT